MSCVLPTIVPHFLQSVNSKFAKEPTFCVLFLCAKGNKVGCCGSVAKFACSPQWNALQAQVFKTRHPFPSILLTKTENSSKTNWQRCGLTQPTIHTKTGPVGAFQRVLLFCKKRHKWWQRRNWLPLQKHAHGVGVQSVSDVGCGVSVGGRGSVFSSAVQVLHWLCWAVCSASWASCSAVRCACSTLGV